MTKNIAIFASGSGTNAETIVKRLKTTSSLNVVLIASNKKDAFVLERAKNLGVPSVVFSKEELNNGKLLSQLKSLQVGFIVLAGFLLKIPDNILSNFQNKIINIHPSLLPKYGGKGMYGNKVHEAVIKNREKQSGITIHFVNENFDEGKIIVQYSCDVNENDTPKSLAKKIHQLEHNYFPKTILELWG